MKTILTISAVCFTFAVTAANLVLIGDSTLAPRSEKSKLGSWGDALKPDLLPGNGIVNRAVGGRTVRTTLPGWGESLTKISKGDFVIIQFGINDAAKKKFVDETEFKATLKRFASDVLAKGAVPVICSPVSNAGWGKNSAADAPFKMTVSRRIYGDYSKAVAKEMKLAFVDMTALTGAELSGIGRDAAFALYVGDTTKKGKPVFDTTHPSKAGAKRFAGLFLTEARKRNLPVAALFKRPKSAVGD